jgi:hypothetical protein
MSCDSTYRGRKLNGGKEVKAKAELLLMVESNY